MNQLCTLLSFCTVLYLSTNCYIELNRGRSNNLVTLIDCTCYSLIYATFLIEKFIWCSGYVMMLTSHYVIFDLLLEKHNYMNCNDLC